MAQKLNANTRATGWSHPNGWGEFRPNGRKTFHGNKDHFTRNARGWSAGNETWAARLFVGFKVGDVVMYEMKDLIEIVRVVREEQTGDPSSSFVSQHGIYVHDSGEVIEEPGAQVVIIKGHKTKPATFKKDVEDLAEVIAISLEQEEVVLEIQKNGITQDTFGIRPG